MLYDIIAWCVFGLIAGAIARFLVPGSDPMGCFATIALGIIGSIVGGFLARLVTHPAENQFHPAGMLGAIIGGVIVLFLWRKLAGPRR